MRQRPLLQEVVPPFLWRAGVKVRRALRRRKRFTYGVEQPAEFYDATFERADHWKQHYVESHYYPLWTVIADRLQTAGAKSILDIGCGPGQVACLLRDAGLKRYLGLDFSESRIACARGACPEFEFIQADAFATDVFQVRDYDCVLTMEFLEHIERDLEILGRIRAGTLIVATVPNFPAAGHVRHFASTEAVASRYSQELLDLKVTNLLMDQTGRQHFVMQGRKAG